MPYGGAGGWVAGPLCRCVNLSVCCRGGLLVTSRVRKETAEPGSAVQCVYNVNTAARSAVSFLTELV